MIVSQLAPRCPAALWSARALRAKWDHDLGCAADDWPGEPSRQHANNREWYTVDVRRAPDDIRNTTEPPLPDTIADHSHRSSSTPAALIVHLCERAAQNRGDAQYLKKPATGPQAIDELGFTTGCQIEPRSEIRKRAVEQLWPPANLVPDGIVPHGGGLTRRAGS